jgi:hypothetical protein
MEVN